MAARTRANVPQRQTFVRSGVDLVVGRIRNLREQPGHRHDHARLAVAALRHLVVDPGLLHFVERASCASPSIVVTFLPAAAETGSVHERTARPSRWTVQAPHAEMPQPNLVPVRPSVSRIAQRSGMSGSTSSACSLPLTVSAMAMGTQYTPV